MTTLGRWGVSAASNADDDGPCLDRAHSSAPLIVRDAGFIGLLKTVRRIGSRRDSTVDAFLEPSLASFLARLEDPSEHQAIGAEHTQTSFTEVEDYYDSRPELSAYTLAKEVTRMQYEVVISDNGTKVTDPMLIQKLYAAGE